MEKEYREYVDALVEKLRLLSDAEEYQISFEEDVEVDQEKEDQIVISLLGREDGTKSCSIRVRDLYEGQKNNGTTVEEVAQRLLQELDKVRKCGFLDEENYLDSYEKAKDRLYVRLLNAGDYKARHTVARIVGDIAMVVCILFQEDEDTCTSAVIREELAASWKVDREELIRQALENTVQMAPPRIYLWEKLLFDQSYEGESFMRSLDEAKDIIRKDCLGNCLSTVKRTNGATAAFYPGVLRHLSQMVGTDLFLVFTSIHEAMVHSVNYNKPESLKKVLMETMEKTTPEKDTLTEEIYRYCRDTDEIVCVTG